MVSRPTISLVCHDGLQQQEDQVKLSPRENNQQAASTESQLIEEFWLSPEISLPIVVFGCGRQQVGVTVVFFAFRSCTDCV